LILLLVFCWINRRVTGVWLLALGLTLNLLVIAANGGFMSISPQTAAGSFRRNFEDGCTGQPVWEWQRYSSFTG